MRRGNNSQVGGARPGGSGLGHLGRARPGGCRLLLGVAVAGTFLTAGTSDTAATAATAPIAARSGTAFTGTPAVGALFTRSHGHLGRHFCTASVVHSPRGDLLITAAHCVQGRDLRPAGRVVFAPGYHSGKFPHGLWQVTAKFVNKQWSSRHDPNNDVAFLIAGPPGTRIERHTGAERLGTSQKLPVQVHVIGYPDSWSKPITCSAPARSYDPGKLRQLRFRCGGYTGGTSGGPFLAQVSAKTGDGTVIGVIGGFQQGGDTPAISYSSKFLANVRALYKVATSARS